MWLAGWLAVNWLMSRVVINMPMAGGRGTLAQPAARGWCWLCPRLYSNFKLSWSIFGSILPLPCYTWEKYMAQKQRAFWDSVKDMHIKQIMLCWKGRLGKVSNQNVKRNCIQCISVNFAMFLISGAGSIDEISTEIIIINKQKKHLS